MDVASAMRRAATFFADREAVVHGTAAAEQEDRVGPLCARNPVARRSPEGYDEAGGRARHIPDETEEEGTCPAKYGGPGRG